MGNLLINHIVEGYKTITIEDFENVSQESNNIIIVIDESSDNRLKDFYEAIRNMIVGGNKVYLIAIKGKTKIAKSLFLLAANYMDYNIYYADSKEIITREYIDTILEREPTIDEVQEYIGGDVSGYADINIILMGINDLISRGDLEGLKGFVEERLNSIEELTKSVEYMKKIVDTSNSKELISRIEELKTYIKELDEKIIQIDTDRKKVHTDYESLTGDNNATKIELSKALGRVKELEQQVSSNTPVIQSYTEINTSLINCKVPSILYFKEVSYVQYTNSLIKMIMELLIRSKKKAKLVIFESRNGLSAVYKPLNVIGGNEFVANKANFLSHSEAFVVVEPNPAILTSILESTDPMFDAVIVYDRMKQSTNIVTGNNVSKFFVIHSRAEYESVKGILKITDESGIITSQGSMIGTKALNIPTIEGYSQLPTDAAKFTQYKSLQATGNKKLVIGTILERAHLR